MDLICSRCRKNKSLKISEFIADSHFEYKFSDIKVMDSRREYVLCERCFTILSNYANPATVLSRVIIWVFWIVGVSLLTTSLLVTFLYKQMYLLVAVCGIWVFVNSLILPISPLVSKKYTRTKWKLGNLIFENREFTQEMYESANDLEKEKMRLKEFDVIYSADEIATEIAEENLKLD